MSKITRIDVFANMDEVAKFYEWAKTKNPKIKSDMIRLLGEYKKADLWVDAHPERVEHEIVKGLKAGRFKQPKGEQK